MFLYVYLYVFLSVSSFCLRQLPYLIQHSTCVYAWFRMYVENDNQLRQVTNVESIETNSHLIHSVIDLKKKHLIMNTSSSSSSSSSSLIMNRPGNYRSVCMVWVTSGVQWVWQFVALIRNSSTTQYLTTDHTFISSSIIAFSIDFTA